MIDNSIKTSSQEVLTQLSARRSPKHAPGDAFGSLLQAMDSTQSPSSPSRSAHSGSAQVRLSGGEVSPVEDRAARPSQMKVRGVELGQRGEAAAAKRAPKSEAVDKATRREDAERTERSDTAEKPENTRRSEKTEDPEKTHDSSPSTSAENAASTQGKDLDATEATQTAAKAAASPGTATDAAATLVAEAMPQTDETQLAEAGAVPDGELAAPLTESQTVAASEINGEQLVQDLKHSAGKTANSLEEVLANPAQDTPDDTQDATLDLADTLPTEAPEGTAETPDLAAAKAQLDQAQSSAADEVAAALSAALTGTSKSNPTNASSTANANSGLVGVNATTNATQATSTPAPLAAAPSSANAAPAAPNAPVQVTNLSQQLFDQMQAQLHRLKALGQGEHQLKLAINPETFGPVRLAVRIHADGSATLQMLAASEAAREQIKQILTDLRRDLAATGLSGQLDLAEDAADFARFAGEAGANAGDGQGTDAGGPGPSRQEAGGSENQGETSYVAPTVGTVLRDGSDGRVDRFA